MTRLNGKPISREVGMAHACNTSVNFNSYRTRKLRRRMSMIFDIISTIWRSDSLKLGRAGEEDKDGLVTGEMICPECARVASVEIKLVAFSNVVRKSSPLDCSACAWGSGLVEILTLLREDTE